MKINHPSERVHSEDQLRQDLIRFIDQPPPVDLPPCPNCVEHLPDDCSPDCKQAASALSSEPDKYPLEPKVVPIAFELASLRIVETCWSCEGHLDQEGKLWRMPQVSFYSASPVYPQLLLRYINKLVYEKRLSYPWHVVLADFGSTKGVTYSLEPNLNFVSDPHLGKLQHDLLEVSKGLFLNLKNLAREMLSKL